MIFFKNIIRKKKIQNYIFTLILILSILIFLELTHTFLNNRYINIKNSKEQRTAVIYSEEDCTLFEKYDLESCMIDNGTTIVILTSNNLKEKFVKEYENDYSIMTFSEQDNNLINMIGYLRNLCIVVIVSLIIIIVIIQYIFIIEDKEVCKLLHSIGYSFNNILIKNILSLNLFYLIIETIVTIIIAIIHLFFSKYLMNLYILRTLAFTCIATFIIVDFVYLIEFKIINRE